MPVLALAIHVATPLMYIFQASENIIDKKKKKKEAYIYTVPIKFWWHN